MLHISVVSLGKSVASTSLSVGLASFLHDRRDGALLVELDPSGGDLAAMWGLSSVVGINNLAGAIAVEELLTPGIIDDVALESPLGFPVVVSSPSGGAVPDKVCSDLGARYGHVLGSGTYPVVCDAGRWRPDEVASHRIAGASAVVALFTPDPAGVTRVSQQLQSLRAAASGAPVLLAVVGENPYPAHEIEAALGGETIRVIPSERNVVRALLSGNASSSQTRKLKKSLWWRSMARIVADVELAVGVEIPVALSEQGETVVQKLFGRKKKSDPGGVVEIPEDGEPLALSPLITDHEEASVPNG